MRLTTNLVDVDPDAVHIGMPVEVVFEDHDPVFLPLFRPCDEQPGADPRPGRSNSSRTGDGGPEVEAA